MSATDPGSDTARPTVVPFRRPAPAAPPTRPPRPAEQEPIWRELAGRVLRDERNRQHRTLGQVAERAGISPQYLSEVERGRKEPSSEMLASICGALGLTLGDLLGGGLQFIRLGAASGFGPPIRPTGPVLMAAGY
ncbi:helix-turn-helix domain-containing protein [Nakamurella lactea]|uniref:helix-turn-helix domain-containing protein n=1 Tax=Nakamurella lactea TaxID=459515 RepID=UPI0004212CE2|nr:helix-turn-helix transcriptional regulator [Nakamurella lactea]